MFQSALTKRHRSARLIKAAQDDDKQAAQVPAKPRGEEQLQPA